MLGELVHYPAPTIPDLKGQPRFMMWPFIQQDGTPCVEFSPYRWSPGDYGIVLKVLKTPKYNYIQILKLGGGLGWIMNHWASPVNKKNEEI